VKLLSPSFRPQQRLSVAQGKPPRPRLAIGRNGTSPQLDTLPRRRSDSNTSETRVPPGSGMQTMFKRCKIISYATLPYDYMCHHNEIKQFTTCKYCRLTAGVTSALLAFTQLTHLRIAATRNVNQSLLSSSSLKLQAATPRNQTHCHTCLFLSGPLGRDFAFLPSQTKLSSSSPAFSSGLRK